MVIFPPFQTPLFSLDKEPVRTGPGRMNILQIHNNIAKRDAQRAERMKWWKIGARK